MRGPDFVSEHVQKPHETDEGMIARDARRRRGHSRRWLARSHIWTDSKCPSGAVTERSPGSVAPHGTESSLETTRLRAG